VGGSGLACRVGWGGTGGWAHRLCSLLSAGQRVPLPADVTVFIVPKMAEGSSSPLGAPSLPPVGAVPARLLSPLGIDFRRAGGWRGSQTEGVRVTCPKEKAWSAELPPLSVPATQAQDGGRTALFPVMLCSSTQLQKANAPHGAQAAHLLGALTEGQCSPLRTLD